MAMAWSSSGWPALSMDAIHVREAPAWPEPNTHLEHHRRRLFEQALEGPQELGGHRAVDGAMVGGQGDGHHRAGDEPIALDDRAPLGGADGEDGDLGEVEDGVE